MTAPDTDSLSTYGGALKNYAPVVDPTTDRDADDMNAALASVAAMTHLAVRAHARLRLGAAPSVEYHDAMWGSLPTQRPTVTHTASGEYVIDWPQLVVDELRQPHAVNLRAGWSNLRTAQPFLHGMSLLDTHRAVLRLFAVGGAPDDATSAIVDVFMV